MRCVKKMLVLAYIHTVVIQKYSTLAFAISMMFHITDTCMHVFHVIIGSFDYIDAFVFVRVVVIRVGEPLHKLTEKVWIQ